MLVYQRVHVFCGLPQINHDKISQSEPGMDRADGLSGMIPKFQAFKQPESPGYGGGGWDILLWIHGYNYGNNYGNHHYLHICSLSLIINY